MRPTIDELNAGGFEVAAEWYSDPSGTLLFKGSVPRTPGLYLFVVGSEVRYVGSARKSLHSRMMSYQRRHQDGASTRPAHVSLGAAIRAQEQVIIFTRQIDIAARTEWQGMQVSIILGAEAALIQDCDPSWNRRERLRQMESHSVNGDDEVPT